MFYQVIPPECDTGRVFRVLQGKQNVLAFMEVYVELLGEEKLPDGVVRMIGTDGTGTYLLEYDHNFRSIRSYKYRRVEMDTEIQTILKQHDICCCEGIEVPSDTAELIIVSMEESFGVDLNKFPRQEMKRDIQTTRKYIISALMRTGLFKDRKGE